MNKVIRKGNEKFLELEDLYRLDDFLTYSNHIKKFTVYREEKQKLGWSFVKIFVKWVIPIWLYIFTGFFLSNIINIANPFLLKALINWLIVNDGDSKGIGLFFGILLVSFIRPFL